MAKDPFGADFKRQFDRELKRLQYHSEGGRERPKKEKPPKLVGKPGSAERIAWIASQADPTIVEELGWEQARANWTAVGTFLQNTFAPDPCGRGIGLLRRPVSRQDVRLDPLDTHGGSLGRNYRVVLIPDWLLERQYARHNRG
jgi:hypothetical protein